MLFFRLETQQHLFGEQHAVAAVRGELKNTGVHANGILGAGFHTVTAKHTFAEINIELPGHFLDLLFGPFAGNDVNAFGRANRLTHHARNATRRAVIALGETVQRAQTRPNRAAHFGILKSHRALPFAFDADARQKEMPKIEKEMPHREHESVPNARQISFFPKSQRFIFVVNVHSAVTGFALLVLDYSEPVAVPRG